MSEKPKGVGFDLPEDFISGIEVVGAKKTKRKGPETKAERRKREFAERSLRSKKVSENTPEVIDVAGEVVEVGSEYLAEDENAVWERPEKSSRENVSGRFGGLNSRKKAGELLEDADKKDAGLIFERAKVFAENKKGATKRPLKENLVKVDFTDPDEMEVDLPNEESIEGVEFNSREEVNRRVGGFDSQKVAARLVEKANYDDYVRELENSFNQAQTIDQLLQIIDSEVDDKKGLQGTQDNFKKSDLKMIIGMLRDKEPGVVIEHVTRSAGLRKKVFELLNASETPDNKPKNKYVVGEDVPVAPDPVIEKINNSDVGYDFDSSKTIEEPEIPEVESNIVRKNTPLVGEEKTIEPIYTPEQFAKDTTTRMEDDPNVLVLPKNESGVEVNNELPEAPLEPLKDVDYSGMSEEEKHFQEIEKDVAKYETLLASKRKELQGLLLEMDDIWDSVEGRPWKKFLTRIDFGRKIEKKDKMIDSVAQEFKKITEELIEKKTDKRLYELNAMHPNTKERKEVETIRLVDVPKDLLQKFPEAIEVFEENGKVINIRALNKADVKLPREFKEVINEMYPDIVRSKVWWKVRNDHIGGENQSLRMYLSDK